MAPDGHAKPDTPASNNYLRFERTLLNIAGSVSGEQVQLIAPFDV